MSPAIKVGDKLVLHVDVHRRQTVMSNHTSTHLVNFGLRKVLKAPDVDQKGSLVLFHVVSLVAYYFQVLPKRFRFDFSHGKPLSRCELEEVDGWFFVGSFVIHCNRIG